MTLLIFGLLLFIATHLIPTFPKLRTTLIDKTSSSAYIGMFSVFSLVSVASIVLGLKTSTF